MTVIASVILVVMLPFVGDGNGGGDRDNRPAENSAPVRSTTVATSRPAVQTIPYRVLERNDRWPMKLGMDIEVGLVDGRLPTKDELTAVMRQLVGSAADRYKNVFVHFLLPGMEVGAGAFAVMNWRGDGPMEVTVLFPSLVQYCRYRHFVPEDQVLFPDSDCR